MASCQAAAATSSSVNRVPDLPDTPHHPTSDFSFPKRDFGKKQVVNARVSLLGFISGNGFITVKPMTMFCVMFVFVL